METSTGRTALYTSRFYLPALSCGVFFVSLYHLQFRSISRSKGDSAVAAAAYRSGSSLTDARTGLVHDYARRAAGSVLHTEILTPGQAPSWARDRTRLWNRVEEHEHRTNARVAREMILALPHELALEQQIALVKDYVQDQFISQGRIADIAIHAPGSSGRDHRNFHAHILLTDRQLDGETFAAKKERSWNSKATLKEHREQWAAIHNRHMERAGFGQEYFIDHRTLKAQGLDRAPQIHQGKDATHFEIRQQEEALRAGKQEKFQTRVGEFNNAVRLPVSREEVQAQTWDRDAYNMAWEERIVQAAIDHAMQHPAGERRARTQHAILKRQGAALLRERPARPVRAPQPDPSGLPASAMAIMAESHRYQDALGALIHRHGEKRAKVEEQNRRSEKSIANHTTRLQAIEKRLSEKGIRQSWRKLTGQTEQDRKDVVILRRVIAYNTRQMESRTAGLGRFLAEGQQRLREDHQHRDADIRRTMPPEPSRQPAPPQQRVAQSRQPEGWQQDNAPQRERTRKLEH